MAEKKKDILWRVYLVFIGFILFALAIIVQVGRLQFVEGDYWKRKQDSLTLRYYNIEPMRGNIYACDGSLLATSLPRYDVHVDLMPAGLKAAVFNDNVDSLAYSLSALFKDKSKSDYKRILREARRDKNHYFLLKRNISFKEQKAIRTFPIFRLGKNKGGLIITQLSRREKPFKNLASRTIGYKIENKAVTPVGIEGAFNSYLQGTKGKRLMQRIAGNVWKPVNNDNEIEPMDGSDVVTTIDLNIQDVAENALMKQLSLQGADMGCAILMEVSTGEIKAIANLKKVGEDSYDEVLNYAISQAAEPGSTFKLASYMVAMEDGYLGPDDIIDSYGGVHNFGSYTMHDSHEGLPAKISVKDAFAHSSNVSVASAIVKSYQKNPQSFIDGLKRLHIDDDLGIQIQGANKIKIKDTKNKTWSGLSLPLMSIGYETQLSPMQILTFYNAVANNGKMIQPLFVKEIRNKGTVVKTFKSKVIADSICSQATIAKAKIMLEEVVKTGTASHIKHAQYTIAGKTGTAQIANGALGFNKQNYQASFCGYFPADKPRYSCIVVIYAPSKGAYYGASVACPVFKEIADKVYALNVDMHDELQRYPDSTFAGNPVFKSGRSNPTTIAAKNLSLPVETPSAGWNNQSLKAVEIPDNKVPNVVGMGLRDAMYLLEGQGLIVKPVGRGTVMRQSIDAGQKIEKGKQIVIELS
jgi:cell division protein FtsI (penicillin-binding protein 3)